MRLLLELREPMNGLIHFVGIILSVLGTVFLVSQVISPLKQLHVVTYSIFGLGLIALYTASTLYHWLNLSPKGISVLRKIDHMMIFVLILLEVVQISK